MTTTSSDLARELGAIVSGETWHASRESRAEEFATGIERLIDERVKVAMGGAKEHSQPMTPDVKPTVQVGDTFDHGPGSCVYEVAELSGMLGAKLRGRDAWNGLWIAPSVLLSARDGWRVVTSVEVPKVAESVTAPDPLAVAHAEIARLRAAMIQGWEAENWAIISGALKSHTGKVS